MSPHAMPLPAPLESRLQQQADSACVPYESLAGLSPEFRVVTLAMIEARWNGLDASYAIDTVLAGIGRGAKKTIVSLETVESQLQVLQMPTPQETIAFVQTSLDELQSGNSRKLLHRLSEA